MNRQIEVLKHYATHFPVILGTVFLTAKPNVAFNFSWLIFFIPSSGCSRGDDSAESGGGGAGSSPRSEEGVPLVRGHTSSASVKSESPASPLPMGLHTNAHQVGLFGKKKIRTLIIYIYFFFNVFY